MELDRTVHIKRTEHVYNLGRIQGRTQLGSAEATGVAAHHPYHHHRFCQRSDCTGQPAIRFKALRPRNEPQPYQEQPRGHMWAETQRASPGRSRCNGTRRHPPIPIRRTNGKSGLGEPAPRGNQANRRMLQCGRKGHFAKDCRPFQRPYRAAEATYERGTGQTGPTSDTVHDM